MDSMFDQAQRFTEMWADLAARMAGSGLAFNPDTPPPDAARQFRAAAFQTLGQHADQFMRSPQFLEMMKQSLEAAITFREQMNAMLTQGRHATEGIARQDVDSVLVSVRHLETRILDGLETLTGRVDAVAQRLDALEAAAPPKKRPPAKKKAAPAAKKANGGGAAKRAPKAEE